MIEIPHGPKPQWVIKRRCKPPEYWGICDATVGFTPNHSKANTYDTEKEARIIMGIYKSSDERFNDAFPCIMLGGDG